MRIGLLIDEFEKLLASKRESAPGPEGFAVQCVPLCWMLWRQVPLRRLPGLGRKPRAFLFDASAFGSLGGEGGVKNPMFLKVWSLVSSDTPTIKTSA